MLGDRILYGVDVIPADDVRARQAHRVQSPYASALATRLSAAAGSAGMVSKSHSRAMVAAACAVPPVTALGIDIEWMAPDRPFDAILANFLPSFATPVACNGFYRAWTFLEAHFKAYQCWPREKELRQVLAGPARDDSWQTVEGNYLLQHQVGGDFQLTVLWRSDQPCGIKYVR
ncbi:4'-phosphopantetheinyl transferase superfamily protein [Rhizomicrobium electricum]|uniref:4'-phosphopantetheinyl transferase domain-containing protein n=1 Tax=Rhizomicrobium electricum TaxID=480070 RepID=A0ABN1ERL3_9PROT|nr:4'-phosphopantetheinyl transferase superfamily protein [Rhizomicrobium electricum]NIJ49016.1 hypothetical protein [Rhizomicrobium electricum]